MAQYNSSFNNLVNTVQPMTGEQTIHVDQIDFDTTCPCQITACDGGTIKVCAKMEVEDLVLDSLCIDGELGCDSLVLKTGITEGLAFTEDPCATPATARRRTLYEDGASTTLQTDTPRNLVFNALSTTIFSTANSISTNATTSNIMTSGDDTTIQSTGGNVNILKSGINSNIGSAVSKFANIFSNFINASAASGEGTNVFTRRINLATTISGVKTFPTPGGAEGILPATTAGGTFAGDLLGDMVIGIASPGVFPTVYMVCAKVPGPGIEWRRLEYASGVGQIFFGAW